MHCHGELLHAPTSTTIFQCDIRSIEQGLYTAVHACTVEPLYNGQIGDWPFVPCREVVPFLEVIIASLLYHKINYYRGKYCARKGNFVRGYQSESCLE